jgi:hypothetical protein
MSGQITGTCQITGTINPGDGTITNAMVSAGAEIARAKLDQDEIQEYVVPWSSFRIHDAIESLLPQPPADDDLGWPATDTFGSVTPYLSTADAKATTVTAYARFQFYLPPEYDSGQTLTCRVRGGMVTTVSDDTATVDVEVHKADRDGACGADICATAAQSINNLTAADKSFTITPTGLVPGDWLDVRITVAITDGSTATAVIGRVYEVAMLLDIRG